MIGPSMDSPKTKTKGGLNKLRMLHIKALTWGFEPGAKVNCTNAVLGDGISTARWTRCCVQAGTSGTRSIIVGPWVRRLVEGSHHWRRTFKDKVSCRLDLMSR